MNTQIKLTKEQAEVLADALLVSEPRVRDSKLAKVASKLNRMCEMQSQTWHWEPSPLCVNQFKDLAGFHKD